MNWQELCYQIWASIGIGLIFAAITRCMIEVVAFLVELFKEYKDDIFPSKETREWRRKARATDKAIREEAEFLKNQYLKGEKK